MAQSLNMDRVSMSLLAEQSAGPIGRLPEFPGSPGGNMERDQRVQAEFRRKFANAKRSMDKDLQELAEHLRTLEAGPEPLDDEVQEAVTKLSGIVQEILGCTPERFQMYCRLLTRMLEGERRKMTSGVGRSLRTRMLFILTRCTRLVHVEDCLGADGSNQLNTTWDEKQLNQTHHGTLNCEMAASMSISAKKNEPESLNVRMLQTWSPSAYQREGLGGLGRPLQEESPARSHRNTMSYAYRPQTAVHIQRASGMHRSHSMNLNPLSMEYLELVPQSDPMPSQATQDSVSRAFSTPYRHMSPSPTASPKGSNSQKIQTLEECLEDNYRAAGVGDRAEPVGRNDSPTAPSLQQPGQEENQAKASLEASQKWLTDTLTRRTLATLNTKEAAASGMLQSYKKLTASCSGRVIRTQSDWEMEVGSPGGMSPGTSSHGVPWPSSPKSDSPNELLKDPLSLTIRPSSAGSSGRPPWDSVRLDATVPGNKAINNTANRSADGDSPKAMVDVLKQQLNALAVTDRRSPSSSGASTPVQGRRSFSEARGDGSRGEAAAKKDRGVSLPLGTEAYTVVCRICENQVPAKLLKEHSRLCALAAMCDDQSNGREPEVRLKSLVLGLADEFVQVKGGEAPPSAAHVLGPLGGGAGLGGDSLERASDAARTQGDVILQLATSALQMLEVQPSPDSLFLLTSLRRIKEALGALRGAEGADTMQEFLTFVPRIIAILEDKVAEAKGEPPTQQATDEHGRTTIADFDIVKPLSMGAFGRVYLARKRATGDLFALKVLRKKDMIIKNMVDQVQAERNILCAAKSPFVVRFFYSFTSEQNLYMVMEYHNGGDCAALLQGMGALEEDVARQYLAETVLALEYIHSNGITHRDLKPDNLLIGSDGHIRLTDFGLSVTGLMHRTTDRLIQSDGDRSDSPLRPSCSSPRQHQASAGGSAMPPVSSPPLQSFMQPGTVKEREKGKHAFGTPDYLAPEILLGTDEVNETVDWWSLGVIAYEFVVGVPPFNGDSPQEIFNNILDRNLVWPEGEDAVSAPLRDLIDKLLTEDPTQRLGYNGAHEVKMHPFFNGLDWDHLMQDKAAFAPAFIPVPEDHEDTSYFDERGLEGTSHAYDSSDPDHHQHMVSHRLREHRCSSTHSGSEAREARRPWDGSEHQQQSESLASGQTSPHTHAYETCSDVSTCSTHSDELLAEAAEGGRVGQSNDFLNFSFKNLPQLASYNMDILTTVMESQGSEHTTPREHGSPALRTSGAGSGAATPASDGGSGAEQFVSLKAAAGVAASARLANLANANAPRRASMLGAPGPGSAQPSQNSSPLREPEPRELNPKP